MARDVSVFVSGFDDGTRLTGAAFRASACAPAARLGVHAWVEGGDPRVLAHELAHTLGARHARDGLMRATVTAGAALRFSEGSRRELRAFVEGDARSGCIGRRGRAGCKANKCGGRCVKGVCVARARGNGASRRRRCAASLLSGKVQVACFGERAVRDVRLAGGARAVVRVSVRHGSVRVRVAVIGRTAAVVGGAAMDGAAPQRFELPRTVSGSQVFDLALARLASTAGNCCGRRVALTLRFVVLAPNGVFRSARYRVSVRLACAPVCGRARGTPLPQNKARACPVCRK